MSTVKINEQVITPQGEVTTIAKLTGEGRITYRKVDNFYTRSAPNGTTKYFADLDYDPDAKVSRGWEITKTAYLSRTGQSDQIKF